MKMATRADQFRYAAQRAKPKKAKASRRKPKGSGETNLHAAHKATHALEPRSKAGRASRKSTRSSANHAKSDTQFNLKEAIVKGSPEARYRRAAAQQRGKR